MGIEIRSPKQLKPGEGLIIDFGGRATLPGQYLDRDVICVGRFPATVTQGKKVLVENALPLTLEHLWELCPGAKIIRPG